MKLHSFSSAILPGRELWARDVDAHAESDVLTALSRLTGVPLSRVKESSLQSLSGILFEGDSAAMPLVTSVGVFHRRRTRFGQQVCVPCIETMGYLKKEWRLSVSFVCTEHGHALIDRCPHCEAPIELFRRELGDVRRTDCSIVPECTSCGKRWRTRDAPRVGIAAIQAQRGYLDALKNGGIVVGNRPVAAVPFFAGVRVLASALLFGRKAKAFRQRVGVLTSRWALSRLSPCEVTCVEQVPCSTRREVFTSIARLLPNWPEPFVTAATSAEMWLSSWTRWGPSLPFWISDIVRERLSRESYRASDGEIESIVKYLKAHGRPATITTVGELLGCRDWGRKVPERLRILRR
jgi:TniQ